MNSSLFFYAPYVQKCAYFLRVVKCVCVRYATRICILNVRVIPAPGKCFRPCWVCLCVCFLWQRRARASTTAENVCHARRWRKISAQTHRHYERKKLNSYIFSENLSHATRVNTNSRHAKWNICSVLCGFCAVHASLHFKCKSTKNPRPYAIRLDFRSCVLCECERLTGNVHTIKRRRLI